MPLRFAVSALTVACCLVVCVAQAQPPKEAPSPKEVQGLTVVPGPGPAVRSTYPASGAAVPGGVLILKIVFDQPMAPKAWAYGRSADGDYPECLGDPRLLDDKKTYVLLCSVVSKRPYAIDINPAPGFASAFGRTAQPYTLKFSTSDADLTRGLHDALQLAGLDDTADPIMTWRDPGQGVSQTLSPPP